MASSERQGLLGNRSIQREVRCILASLFIFSFLDKRLSIREDTSRPNTNEWDGNNESKGNHPLEQALCMPLLPAPA